MGVSSRYFVRNSVVVCELTGYGQTSEIDTTLDRASWRDLGEGYAVDARTVVRAGETIDDADASTFTLLRGGWAKDESTVYKDGAPVDAPDDDPWDSASFVAFGPRYVADRRGVFCFHYGYDGYELELVEGASATSFEEIGLGFGRDRASGVLYNNGVVEAQIDGRTFELRGRWFAVDRTSVHHLCHGGKHTDAVSLVRIDADASTFVVLGEHYAADARTVFYFLNDDGDADLGELRALPDVVPSDFEPLPAIDPGYARAGDHILNHGEVERGIADARTFEPLAPGFCRDAQHVYRMTRTLREFTGAQTYSVEVFVPAVVAGADPEHFMPSASEHE